MEWVPVVEEELGDLVDGDEGGEAPIALDVRVVKLHIGREVALQRLRLPSQGRLVHQRSHHSFYLPRRILHHS